MSTKMNFIIINVTMCLMSKKVNLDVFSTLNQLKKIKCIFLPGDAATIETFFTLTFDIFYFDEFKLIFYQNIVSFN